MRLPEEPEPSPQINIVPMIDVIFAILAFFIVATMFLTRSEGLRVNLPEAKNTVQNTAAESQRITITTDSVVILAIDQQPIQLDALEQQIRALVATQNEVLVILNADEAVQHGAVIAVMDRMRGIPGVRLAIATTRPQP